MNINKFHIIFILISTLLLYNCSSDSSGSSDEKPYIKNGKEALVIVVESNNHIGEPTNTFLNTHKDEFRKIFADIFDIDESTINNMPFPEIIDIYGESWIINEIAEIADVYYSKFESLSDDTATTTNTINKLSGLCMDGYIIDLLFLLHGDSNTLWFTDQLINISDLLANLESENISIRSLYQTTCYGNDMIDDWEGFGITAVNGAEAANSLTLFSSIYFLENWTSGMTFNQAVERAYQDEINTYMSFKSEVPEIESFLSTTLLNDSRQHVGGTNPSLLWNEF